MQEEFRNMSYPDRHQMAVREGAWLPVYVPATDIIALAPRSGIVGRPYEGEPDHLLIDYEGWVNGPMQYEHLDARGKWEAAVQHAAGRAFVEYPTIARRLVKLSALRQVGTIRADGILTITDEAGVSAWLSR